MSVSDQFKGLEMEQLIGAPLGAAADASIKLTQLTDTMPLLVTENNSECDEKRKLTRQMR